MRCFSVATVSFNFHASPLLSADMLQIHVYLPSLLHPIYMTEPFSFATDTVTEY